MAIRRRELHPDETILTRSGREIATVSEEQFLTQLVDLGRWQMFAGGVIQSVIFRAPTDLDGEMVTVGGVLEWKDRTDAKAQPEPESLVREAGEKFAVLAEKQARNDWEAVQEAVEAGAEVRVEAGSLTAEEQAMPPTDEIPAIAHEEDPSPRKAEAAPPASSEGIGDGLEGIDPDAEDDSEIPEHLRGTTA